MKEKLNILWTSGDPLTAKNMVLMYAINGKYQGWWDDVKIILWGSSVDLVARDEEVQKLIKVALETGVSISACKACVDNLKYGEIISDLGIEVKYWGVPLTEILKSDGKLLTI